MAELPAAGVGALFDACLSRGDAERACAIAMELATSLLRADAELYRAELWNRYFSRLDKHYRAQYQSYDFEIADYQMFAFGRQSPQLFRGPRPAAVDLASGNYVTVFGAAQLFGRYHRVSFCDRLKETLDIPFLNLSFGGAGPDFYLRDSEMMTVANRGRAVILQVLSGRSVGCDEYPGMRMTARAGSDDAPEDRIALLTRIWGENRHEALRLVKKWQPRYVDLMKKLIASVSVPVILVWVSDRRPSDWTSEIIADSCDFGSFPQLVDAPMVRELAKSADVFMEVPPDPQPEFHLTSRLTGKRCPFFRPNGSLGWVNSYYPSEQPQIELARALQEPLRKFVS
ncbi:MAG: hypothetical protein IE927_09235 [Rhodobacterales bacterium]|nr:hypothetical protein [Rhodobacterales bacterium]